MVIAGVVVGVLVLPVTMSLFLPASTKHMGPTSVGLFIMRVGYFDPNRSKAPSPSNQL
jgi:hypothetical protein